MLFGILLILISGILVKLLSQWQLNQGMKAGVETLNRCSGSDFFDHFVMIPLNSGLFSSLLFTDWDGHQVSLISFIIRGSKI